MNVQQNIIEGEKACQYCDGLQQYYKQKSRNVITTREVRRPKNISKHDVEAKGPTSQYRTLNGAIRNKSEVIWQHQCKLVPVYHILRNAKVAILRTSESFREMPREGIARIVES